MRDAFGRYIEIDGTKEAVDTLLVDQVLLHSKYYPEREAINFIERNKEKILKKDIIVIYGIALGYHLKVLLSIIGEFTSVKVFDLDEELYKITKDRKLISEISRDKRVELFIGDNSKFYSEFSKALQEVEDIIIYKPSIRALPQNYAEFKDILERYDVGKANVEKYADLMNENKIRNANLNCDNISSFISTIDINSKPIVIVSAGPSLDNVIKDLKFLRDSVVVFAAGSALKPLMKNHIIPDMFCIIDPNEIISRQIDGCKDLSIPLCFLNTASNKAIAGYEGPKYIFYNESHEGDIVIETGKSVATAIISIATILHGDPIILVGQDLAFINNKSHCSNYPNEILSNDYAFNKKVMGVSGDQLDTTPVFLYFKNWIENKIKEHRDIRFINCSNGARIEGTKEMTLKDAIKYK